MSLSNYMRNKSTNKSLSQKAKEKESDKIVFYQSIPKADRGEFKTESISKTLPNVPTPVLPQKARETATASKKTTNALLDRKTQTQADLNKISFGEQRELEKAQGVKKTIADTLTKQGVKKSDELSEWEKKKLTLPGNVLYKNLTDAFTFGLTGLGDSKAYKEAFKETEKENKVQATVGTIAGSLGGQGILYKAVNKALAGTKIGSTALQGGLKGFGASQGAQLVADAIVQTPVEIIRAIEDDKDIDEFGKDWLVNRGIDALMNTAMGGIEIGLPKLKQVLTSDRAKKVIADKGIPVDDLVKAVDEGDAEKVIFYVNQYGVTSKEPFEQLQLHAPKPQELGIISDNLSNKLRSVEQPKYSGADFKGKFSLTERKYPTTDIGNRKVNAFQYDNPEVQPFFREKAIELLDDATYAKRGGHKDGKILRDEFGEVVNREGNFRATTPQMARILDETGYGYEDVKKALKDIIEDNGKENHALAKRIETVIDDMLVEGYVNIVGENIRPNIRYIQMRNRLDPTKIQIPELEGAKASQLNNQLTMGEITQGGQASMFDSGRDDFDDFLDFVTTPKGEKYVPTVKQEVKQEINRPSEFSIGSKYPRLAKDFTTERPFTVTPSEAPNLFTQPTTLSTKDELKNKFQEIADRNKVVSENVGLETDSITSGQIKERGFSENIRTDANRVDNFRIDIPVEDGLALGQKFRQTIVNSLEKSEVDDAVKQELRDNPEVYDAITNQDTWDKAWETVSSNRQGALDRFRSKDSLTSADDTAEAISLIHQYSREGNTKEAVQIARELSEKATRSGQAIQAIVMLQRTTPEGQLYRATRTIDSVEKAFKETEPVKYKKFQEELAKSPEKADELRKKYKLPTLSDEEADYIIKRMTEAQQLDGRAREIAIAQVEQMIADKVPATLREKLIAIRNMSLLLNPKTLITRNPLGNLVFSGLENISQIPSGITDAMVSKILKTQRQTKILPDLKTQAKGFGTGLKQTLEDSRLNIDTSPTRGQAELPRNRKVFELSWLNKPNNWLSNALQLGDRPFYQAAYDARLKELMDLQPNAPKEELEQLAKDFAIERVFQNEGQTSKAMGKLKSALNDLVNVKGFGLGDIAMPYTQTPANILAKGLEYTPLNIINVGKKAFDLKRLGTGNAQKQFTDSVGRMFTGTGIIALGYNLAKDGHIEVTGKQPTSEKEKKLWEAQGKRNYSIRIGDKWYSFDWAQPAAMPLALGIDYYLAGEKEELFADKLQKGLISAGDTIFKQGMLQGINRMFGGYSPTKSITETLISAPTQFVPTLSSQFSQLIDPFQREVNYGGFSGVGEQITSRTPFRTTLPERQTMFGEPIKASTGEITPSKIIETFLSPSIVSREIDDPVTKEVARLYEVVKDTDVIPYKMPNKADTPEKQQQFTTYFGSLIRKELEKTFNSSEYKASSDTMKAKIVRSKITKVYDKSVDALFK